MLSKRNITAWALVTLCSFAYAAAQQSAPARPGQARVVSARVGEITRVAGTASVHRRGETELRALGRGDVLGGGDMVVTGDGGRAEWTLNFGSVLQVGPRSRAHVYSVAPDSLHFDIERGEVFAVVAALDSLVLDTPPALLNVVKGGRYRVRVAADEATEAAVRQGELQFVDGAGQTIRVTKRRRVRFAASQRRQTWDKDTATVR